MYICIYGFECEELDVIVESLAICTLFAYEVDGEVGLPYPYLIPKVFPEQYFTGLAQMRLVLGLSR